MRRTPEWGEDGSAIVPVDVWVQTQHEMMVTGAAACDVAVLFGLHTFHVYHLTRDEDFIGTLVPKLEAWWADYVATKTPPPVSAHPADEAWSKRWEQTEPGLRNATPEQETIFRQYAMARANAAQADRAKTQLENVIRELIGPAEGIKGDFGTVTYRQAKDSTKVGWQEIATVYRMMIDELLELANPGDDEQAVATLAQLQQQLPLVPGLYTVTVPGTRRLNVSFSEEGTGDE
jgi:predicted phage-related endonuclease